MTAANMKTMADALRWALMRIGNSTIGQGEYYERAVQILTAEDEARAALLSACKTARDVVATERQSFADWLDDAAVIADYDRVLAQCDAAIAAATGTAS